MSSAGGTGREVLGLAPGQKSTEGRHANAPGGRNRFEEDIGSTAAGTLAGVAGTGYTVATAVGTAIDTAANSAETHTDAHSNRQKS